MSLLLADIDATCAALSRYDGEKYCPEPDALQGLKHLIWILRRDVDTYDYRRHFGRSKVLQTDLIPMLTIYINNEEYTDVLVRLLIILTNPTPLLYRQGLPKDGLGRKIYLELIDILQNYKAAFVCEKFWTSLRSKLLEVLQEDWALRSEDQNLLIERILVLLRNILHVPSNPSNERRPDNDASLHDQIIWVLHQSKMLDLVLYIISSTDESQYHLHALEIVCLMYREQTAESLADASLQRSFAEKYRDEQELNAARLREKQHSLTRLPPGRHSRFGGTYVIQNVKSISDRDIICHQSLERAVSVNFDREKPKQKRSHRVVGEDNVSERRSAFIIRLCLREYCIEILRSAFNTFVRKVRGILDRNSNTGTASQDDSYLLWAIRFFMEFNRLSGMQLDLVSETMSVQCFHWVLMRMQHHIDMMTFEKKEARIWSKRLHIAIQAFRELLLSLISLQKLKDDKALALFDMLQNNVCYVLEYRETILSLLMNYNEMCSTKTYLRDLVETVNIFIKIMEKFCKDPVVVQDIKRRQKQKQRRNKALNEKSKNKEKEKENLEDKWAVLTSEIATNLTENIQFLEEDYPIPFDAASEKSIDEQKEDCMLRLYKFLRQEKVQHAIILMRSAREVWPENDYFGASTSSPEDELMLLREIYLSNLGEGLWDEYNFEAADKRGHQNAETQKQVLTDNAYDTDFSPEPIALNSAVSSYGNNLVVLDNEDACENRKSQMNVLSDDTFPTNCVLNLSALNSNTVEKSSSEHESDDDEENNEEYDDEDGVNVVEKNFSFEDFLKKLISPRVVRACTIVLSDWEKISTKALKSAVTILHRIAFGCKCVAMLYQASLFQIFQQVFHASKNSHNEELHRLGVHVIRKFVENATTNPKIYAELLFYKSLKEAYELENGYTDEYGISEKDLKSKWSEEQENELRMLFEENQRNPENDKDVIDWILDNLIDKNRTRRSVLKKLSEMGLMFKAPTKRSNAAAAKKNLWRQEEDEQLRHLYDEYRLEDECLIKILQILGDNHKKNDIIKRMIQLGLIADKSEILPSKRKKARRNRNHQNLLEGAENNYNDRDEQIHSFSESNTESDDSDSDDNNDNISTRQPTTFTNNKSLKRKQSIRNPLHINTIADLLSQIDEKFQEAVDWLKECLNDATEDYDEQLGQDNEDNDDVPLLPLSEVQKDAMNNDQFQKLLIALGIQPPIVGQESYWRIPVYLNVADLKLRVNVLNGIHTEPDSETDNDNDDARCENNLQETIARKRREHLDNLVFNRSDDEDENRRSSSKSTKTTKKIEKPNKKKQSTDNISKRNINEMFEENNDNNERNDENIETGEISTQSQSVLVDFDSEKFRARLEELNDELSQENNDDNKLHKTRTKKSAYTRIRRNVIDSESDSSDGDENESQIVLKTTATSSTGEMVFIDNEINNISLGTSSAINARNIILSDEDEANMNEKENKSSTKKNQINDNSVSKISNKRNRFQANVASDDDDDENISDEETLGVTNIKKIKSNADGTPQPKQRRRIAIIDDDDDE